MTLDISRIRALCFDVDGTLSDTDDLWIQKFTKVMQPFSLLFPGHQVEPAARWLVMTLETPGNFLYHLLDRFSIDDQIARLFNYLARHNVGRRPKSMLIIPNVKETILRLAGHFPMAIVSARDSSTTFNFLEQFDLKTHFDCVATAQTCRYTKPFPDPILWAAREMNVSPQECLMVGDTAVDIRAGKAAGAQTVGVLCGFGREDELRLAGADLILLSTADLSGILLPG
jgi:phosphoglycolate phosphatase-like HAD superfamily hydrolase